jgi:hypothetical protein
MPTNHSNGHFKNGHKLYQETAYRYHADIPTRQFVSWDKSKFAWLIFVVLVVIGMIFFLPK